MATAMADVCTLLVRHPSCQDGNFLVKPCIWKRDIIIWIQRQYFRVPMLMEINYGIPLKQMNSICNTPLTYLHSEIVINLGFHNYETSLDD